MAFLRSVDERLLTGHGYALTLTLRDCPADPQAWSAMRRAWLERQRRAGLIRAHWVMELQRRGVPHLHLAAWYQEELRDLKPLRDWVEVAAACRPGLQGQQARPLDGPVGWFRYLSKHVSRGHRHYQRHGLPEGWESSGRVWGHVGAWPTIDPEAYEVTREAWYRFRRLLRAAAVAEARRWAPLNVKPLMRARASLRCPFPELSAVRGFSEWVSPSLQLQLVQAALRGSRAHRILPPAPEPVEERPAQGGPAAGGR